MSPFFVTVRRRGVAPFSVRLLVRARSQEEAAGLASALVERRSGGFFDVTSIRRANEPVEQNA